MIRPKITEKNTGSRPRSLLMNLLLPMTMASAAMAKTTINESSMPLIGRLKSLLPAKRATSAMRANIPILPQAPASSIFVGIEIEGR